MENIVAMAPGPDALDAIAEAAEATRPQEPGTLFSPRSSAALTLSSISMQQSGAQQILFDGENEANQADVPEGVDENSTPTNNAEHATKEDFFPPKEPKTQPSSHITHKTRRVSDGPHNLGADENAPLPANPPAVVQRSTSLVATPGGSANKLSFAPPPGDARASFPPPLPVHDVYHNGNSGFFGMQPSNTQHASQHPTQLSASPSNAENYPNSHSGSGNTPETVAFQHHEPYKYNAMNHQQYHHHNPHYHAHHHPHHPHPHQNAHQNQHQNSHQKYAFQKTSPVAVDHQQPQQSHSVDFQPPAWKNHPNKEQRQSTRLVPAPTHRPYRTLMAMPAPSWSDPSATGWEQSLPPGTPFIMHQGQLYPYYPQHHPQMAVTPTPQKKQKLDAKLGARTVYPGAHGSSSQTTYPKQKKSLGVLAVGFMDIYEKEKGKRSREDFEEGKQPILSGNPAEIVIDQVAIDLEVERRRIYDVVNILEALRIVVKKGKNTYEWKGREHLARQFALMQQEAIETWSEHAVAHGVISESDVQLSSSADDIAQEESKSLTRLSQLFLHVFLVGFDNVNLPQVSDLIHGRKSSKHDLAKLGSQGQEPPKDPNEFTKAATRGLKTKIRRLYDVANVFLAVGLLRKTENRIAATIEGKRPHYHWNFEKDARGIQELYQSLDKSMKDGQTPFFSGQEKAKPAFSQIYTAPSIEPVEEKTAIVVKQEKLEEHVVECEAPAAEEPVVQYQTPVVAAKTDAGPPETQVKQADSVPDPPKENHSTDTPCISTVARSSEQKLMDEVAKGSQFLMNSIVL